MVARRPPAAMLAVALLLACVSGLAHGFAVSPNNAVLNKLLKQRTITSLTGELNPYGLALISKSMGKLTAGNFLATQWNDAKNNPGQGHSILQVTPTGQTTVFATIDPKNSTVQAKCGNFGVGLTMALSILSKGFVVVGSTPVPIGGTVAGPGCLLLLDSNGVLLDAHAANEPTTTPGVRTGGGPWGMAVQESNGGSNANLYVSYVLGTCPACTNTLTGAQGGMVVRYQLQVPGGPFAPNFWGNAPDVIASGFPTAPGNITAGAVGPSGLLVVKDKAHKDRLFIANTLNSSVVATPNPGGCFTRPKATPQCIATPHAWGSLISGPVGLALSPRTNTIVGANGFIGTLFEFKPAAYGNQQLAVQLVDNTPSTVGGGTLFNVLFINNGTTLVFNDDGMNSFNTLTAN